MDIDVNLWRHRIREETFSQYHYEMARAIAREGNMGAAVDAYRRAIGIRPDYPEAYFRLAALFEENGQSDQARAVEAAALAVNPHYVAWAWHRFAHEACGEGRYDDAIAALEKALSLHPGLKLDPELAMAHYRLAVDAEREGRCDAAGALLRDGLRVAPDDVRMWWLLGQTHLTQCLFEPARRALAATLAFQPADPMTLSTLALVLQACGQMEEAVRHHACAARSASAQPAPVLANILCNAAFVHYARADLREASACIERALSLDPYNPNVSTHRGIVAFLSGRFGEAESCLRDALATLPDYGFAESNLGLVLGATGRTEEALEMHRRSIPHLGIRRRLFVVFRPWAAAALTDIYRQLGLDDDA